MSLTTKQVSVCTEVDALLGLVVTAVTELKAGKTVAQVVLDLGPQVVGVLTGVGELKAEVSDLKDLQATIALKGAELLTALGL